jgi:hypothetical protein
MEEKMKFIEGLEKIEHEELMDMAKKIGKLSDNIIYKNYFYLLEFAKRNTIKKDIINLIGIAHMVYGWMPTMLDNINDKMIKNEEGLLSIWNNIISGSLDKIFLENIKSITNNSIRGGSKLLHFINPNSYAIFDSVVYRAITKDNGFKYEYNYSVDNYILYMEKLMRLAKDKINMDLLKNEFHKNNEMDNRISNLRYIELCLYYSEKV